MSPSPGKRWEGADDGESDGQGDRAQVEQQDRLIEASGFDVKVQMLNGVILQASSQFEGQARRAGLPRGANVRR